MFARGSFLSKAPPLPQKHGGGVVGHKNNWCGFSFERWGGHQELSLWRLGWVTYMYIGGSPNKVSWLREVDDYNKIYEVCDPTHHWKLALVWPTRHRACRCRRERSRGSKLGHASAAMTCQARVVPCHSSSSLPPSLPRRLSIPMGTARPHPQAPDPSGRRRTYVSLPEDIHVFSPENPPLRFSLLTAKQTAKHPSEAPCRIARGLQRMSRWKVPKMNGGNPWLIMINMWLMMVNDGEWVIPHIQSPRWKFPKVNGFLLEMPRMKWMITTGTPNFRKPPSGVTIWDILDMRYINGYRWIIS